MINIDLLSIHAQMIIQRHYSDMQILAADNLDKTMRGKAGVNSSEMRLR